MAARHVSVVVPTKNAERTLARCLASLQRQTVPPLEVIVVDNFSTDATVAIAERCGTRVYRHGSERSEQRNCGTRLARGDCVLFVDADMYLQPGAVAASARALLDHDAVVLPEASFGAGFWARCRALERRCYVGSSLEAARGFRREVLTRLGGYDENLFAFEDWDLHNRCAAAGYRVGRAGSGQILVTHDEGLLSLGQSARKKHYYGGALQRYAAKHPHLARQQTGALPRLKLLLRHWPLLARHPLLTAGVIVLKAVEGSAGRVAARSRALRGARHSPKEADA